MSEPTANQVIYDTICEAFENAGLTVVDGEVENEVIVTGLDGRSFVVKFFTKDDEEW